MFLSVKSCFVRKIKHEGMYITCRYILHFFPATQYMSRLNDTCVMTTQRCVYVNFMYISRNSAPIFWIPLHTSPLFLSVISCLVRKIILEGMYITWRYIYHIFFQLSHYMSRLNDTCVITTRRYVYDNFMYITIWRNHVQTQAYNLWFYSMMLMLEGMYITSIAFFSNYVITCLNWMTHLWWPHEGMFMTMLCI